MPYEKERANPLGAESIVVSPLIRERLKTYRKEQIEVSSKLLDEAPIIEAKDLPHRTMSKIESLDGSVKTLYTDDRIAEIGFVKVASVKLDLEKRRELSQMNYVSILESNSCYEDKTIDLVLPGRGIEDSENGDSGIDKFRREFYQGAKECSFGGSTLLDGLMEVFEEEVEVSCAYSGKENCSQKVKVSWDPEICPVCGTIQYPTDVLEVDRYVKKAPALIFTAAMNSYEKLALAAKLVDLFSAFENDPNSPEIVSTAYLVDGPLSVFESPAFAKRLRGYTRRVSEHVVLAGFEKTGRIVKFAEGRHGDLIPPGSVLMLTKDLRLALQNPGSAFDERYFGKHFIYKSLDGRRFVFTVPPKTGTSVSSGKGLETWENYPSVGTICKLIEETKEDQFGNNVAALSSIARANSAASIPNAVGELILKDFIRDTL